ncbi:hypothetical protein VNI00_011571 [Paramarasmius palmivorus]|uniref:Uncharacterized protein n=1 Tax=Paramarasmius palmivorus TaxID=297713 RepID=A0AAW0CEP3_9AGAR
MRYTSTLSSSSGYILSIDKLAIIEVSRSIGNAPGLIQPIPFLTSHAPSPWRRTRSIGYDNGHNMTILQYADAPTSNLTSEILLREADAGSPGVCPVFDSGLAVVLAKDPEDRMFADPVPDAWNWKELNLKYEEYY